MDIAPSITTTTASTKSPEADSDTPTRIQPAKPISFSNGVLKRHNPTHHHHSHHHNSNIPVTPVVVSYKECLKNHAASLGGHALDGCGEFMPSPTSTPSDPTSLKCAACGCHRNFHRRDPEDNIPAVAPATHVIEYQPHHRHHPPPPIIGHRSPNSASPPPISSSYYPSAPHMLLALSTGLSDNPNNHHGGQIVSPGGPNSRKRFRTKFSQEQKDKMFQFAERVGWKMQKRDEDIVHEFCNEIGVDKGVLKVWMHNNKNTFAKRDGVVSGSGGALNGISATVTARIPNNTSLDEQLHNNMNGNNNNNNTSNDDDEEDDHPNHHHHNGGGSLGNIPNPNHHHNQVGRDHPHGVTNGGSSSSS
ncbi:hypothetical protein ACLB2K_054157 [Fragaria x ananassa]